MKRHRCHPAQIHTAAPHRRKGWDLGSAAGLCRWALSSFPMWQLSLVTMSAGIYCQSPGVSAGPVYASSEGRAWQSEDITGADLVCRHLGLAPVAQCQSRVLYRSCRMPEIKFQASAEQLALARTTRWLQIWFCTQPGPRPVIIQSDSFMLLDVPVPSLGPLFCVPHLNRWQVQLPPALECISCAEVEHDATGQVLQPQVIVKEQLFRDIEHVSQTLSDLVRPGITCRHRIMADHLELLKGHRSVKHVDHMRQV